MQAARQTKLLHVKACQQELQECQVQLEQYADSDPDRFKAMSKQIRLSPVHCTCLRNGHVQVSSIYCLCSAKRHILTSAWGADEGLVICKDAANRWLSTCLQPFSTDSACVGNPGSVQISCNLMQATWNACKAGPNTSLKAKAQSLIASSRRYMPVADSLRLLYAYAQL